MTKAVSTFRILIEAIDKTTAQLNLISRAMTEQLGNKVPGAAKKSSSALSELTSYMGKTFTAGHVLIGVAMGIGQAISTLPGKILSAIGSLKSSFTAAINTATEFGKKIAEISTIANPATLSIKDITNEALLLASVYGGSAVQQADAFYQAISYGARNTSEALMLMQAANKLAVTGLSDVKTAANLLLQTSNAFGLDIRDSDKLAAKFFATIKDGAVRLEEMGNTFGFVSNAARNAGLPAEQLFAAMAALTKVGVKWDHSIVSINQLLSSLSGKTKKAERELATLNASGGKFVDWSAQALREKGFGQFLLDISTHGRRADETAKNLTGNARGLRAMLGIVANNAREFKIAFDDIVNSGTAFDEAFKKIEVTLAHQKSRFEGAKGSITTLAGTWVTNAPVIAGAISGINDMLSLMLIDMTKMGITYDTTFEQANKAVRGFVADVLLTVSKLITDLKPTVQGIQALGEVIIGFSKPVFIVIKGIISLITELPGIVLKAMREAAVAMMPGGSAFVATLKAWGLFTDAAAKTNKSVSDTGKTIDEVSAALDTYAERLRSGTFTLKELSQAELDAMTAEQKREAEKRKAEIDAINRENARRAREAAEAAAAEAEKKRLRERQKAWAEIIAFMREWRREAQANVDFENHLAEQRVKYANQAKDAYTTYLESKYAYALEIDKKIDKAEEEAKDAREKRIMEGVDFFKSIVVGPFQGLLGDITEAFYGKTVEWQKVWKTFLANLARSLVISGFLFILDKFFGGIGTALIGAKTAADVTVGAARSVKSATQGAALGGSIRDGKLIRASSGGLLAGGIKGRDSIHVLAQEDEAILPVNLVRGLRSVLAMPSSSSAATSANKASTNNTTVVFQPVTMGLTRSADNERWFYNEFVPIFKRAKAAGVI